MSVEVDADSIRPPVKVTSYSALKWQSHFSHSFWPIKKGARLEVRTENRSTAAAESHAARYSPPSPPTSVASALTPARRAARARRRRGGEEERRERVACRQSLSCGREELKLAPSWRLLLITNPPQVVLALHRIGGCGAGVRRRPCDVPN